MRSTVANLSHAVDQDLVNQNLRDQRAPFRAFDPTLHALPRRLRNKEICFIPQRRKQIDLAPI